MQEERTLSTQVQPVPAELDALFDRPRSSRTDSVRRVGRLRVPLALPYRPWATLYRMPDGRTWWILRLWELDGPVRRCVPTSTLLAYARRNRLRGLEREIEELLAREV